MSSLFFLFVYFTIDDDLYKVKAVWILVLVRTTGKLKFNKNLDLRFLSYLIQISDWLHYTFTEDYFEKHILPLCYSDANYLKCLDWTSVYSAVRYQSTFLHTLVLGYTLCPCTEVTWINSILTKITVMTAKTVVRT